MRRYLEFYLENNKVVEYGSMEDVIEDLKLYMEEDVEYLEIYDPFYDMVVFCKDGDYLDDPLNLLEEE